MNPYAIVHQTQRQRVSDGMTRTLLENCEGAPRTLLLVWPQLGDFDSLEYAWWLKREAEQLQAQRLAIRALCQIPWTLYHSNGLAQPTVNVCRFGQPRYTS